MNKKTIIRYIEQRQEYALLSAKAVQKPKDIGEEMLYYYWRGYYKGLEHLKLHIEGDWDEWF